jgi:hypothetical protein
MKHHDTNILLNTNIIIIYNIWKEILLNFITT